MRKLFLVIQFAALALCVSAFADALPSPSPISAAAGAVGGWAAWVKAFSNGALIMSIGGALEFLLRLIPSKEPLSIAYALDDMLKALGDLFKSLGDAMDKILPNRISGKE